MHQDASGNWRPHPSQTEQSDWAEFVSQALASAAANIGGVEAVLAGRPGSWEADHIRNLLHATVGHDEAYLVEHRTEPMRVVVPLEQILADRGIDQIHNDAYATLDAREAEALAQVEDVMSHLWYYERTDAGEFVCSDPAAPPWSIEAWRADLLATCDSPQVAARIEHAVFDPQLTHGVYVSKPPQARRAVQRIDARRTVIEDRFQVERDTLHAAHQQERADYAQELVQAVRDRAATLYPGIPVQVEVAEDPADDLDPYLDDSGRPEARLLEHAREHAHLPGAGPQQGGCWPV